MNFHSVIPRTIVAWFIIMAAAAPLRSQSELEWRQDLDTLVMLMEKHHPQARDRMARPDFLERLQRIRTGLPRWNREKITVELMGLVAALQDGHSEILLSGQSNFNLWFPLRMERFEDGLFITAAAEAHAEWVGAKVLKLAGLEAEEAYRRVAEIVAKDGTRANPWPAANYLPNAIILKALDINPDEKKLDLEVAGARGEKRTVSVTSAPWSMRKNWTWNKLAVPARGRTVSIFDHRLDRLPPYLAKLIPERIPYWFEHFPAEKLLFLQFNNVTNWTKEPFPEFTRRLFREYDEKRAAIEKFVIDLRFNEGGNGYLLEPFVQEFILRRDSLKRGTLFIITGRHTFSAATRLIGQMLRQTAVITVGDIAPGPLNWCSDVMDFVLPRSNLTVQLSTMFWMEGHAMDRRGCYPPDYYLPETFAAYHALLDPPLEAIKNNQAMPLKDILLHEGREKFKAELDKRQALCPDLPRWFPYTHFDLILLAFFDLLPAGKTEDALELLKFNTRLYPDEYRSWYGLAETGKNLGQSGLALPAYERLLALEPHLGDIRPAYHTLLLLKEFNENGVKALARLFLELKRNHPGTINEATLNNLGYELLNKDRTAPALEILTLNTELHPDYANGYNSLGEAFLKAGDRQKARQAYEKALQLNPESIPAKQALEKLNNEQNQ